MPRVHPGGVPRVHRRHVRLELRLDGPARLPVPGIHRRTRLRTPATPPRRLLHLADRPGHLAGVLQPRPDHLGSARRRPPGPALRTRYPGDRFVVGPPAAHVPLLLGTVERPLPGVVRLRGRADRRNITPARLAGPPPRARRLGAPEPARPRTLRLVVVLVVVRGRVPAATVRAAYAGLDGPPGKVRVDRLLLAPLDRPSTARGAVPSARTGLPEADRRDSPRERPFVARADHPLRVPSPGVSRPERDPSQPKAQSAVRCSRWGR